MVPFLHLAPLCVEEKLLGAGGKKVVFRERAKWRFDYVLVYERGGELGKSSVCGETVRYKGERINRFPI